MSRNSQHLQKLRRKEGNATPSASTPSTPASGKKATKGSAAKNSTGKRKKATPGTNGDEDAGDDHETPSKKPKKEEPADRNVKAE